MNFVRRSLASAALVALPLIAMPVGAADSLPATNDFILRAPAAEAAGIASRNGLTIVEQVATAVDEDGHSIFLMRAPSGTSAATVISDIEEFEPEAGSIEQAVLASLPKLDQSAALILDTSAVTSALGAIDGFDPPTATVSAVWNGHLHDREVEHGHTEALEFEFEQPADPNPANYALSVDFSNGSTATYDPAACHLVVEPALDLSSDKAKWRLVNTTGGVLTLDSMTAGWSAANGDVIAIKFGGATVYDQPLPAASATVSTGWLDTVDKRRIGPGGAADLELKFASTPIDSDPASYTLSVSTVEGAGASFDSTGGPCAGHVNELVTVSGNQIRFNLTNYGTSDLVVDSVTLTWPAVNGKLLLAALHSDSLLDAPYGNFGDDGDGDSDRDDFSVWTGYLNQAATVMLELDDAQEIFKGQSTVAIIDTGIDPTHEVLSRAIVPGYDFINDIAGTASEWPDLDQSAALILDQSAALILDQSAALILDQSAALILDQSAALILDTSSIPPAFGHGTMVAGIIHRTAPEASLMPLKVFDSNGYAHLYDVVDAIYYAVDNGANVINMSFSLETFSPALMRAINYAARNGVACIASAGNLGEEMLVFPAALGNTLGVASVDENNELSAFSNWGSDLVTVSAPGENIVTTYPGSRFAVVSGTSFAAPWVAGGAALFADKLGTKHAPGLADYYLTSNALADADAVSGSGQGKSGHGRANLKRAMQRVKSGRYANNRPLGQYTITAGFAEGCSANYPPPAPSGACTAEGAGQLRFDGKKVFWLLENQSEIDLTLDSITIDWETDNGELRRIKLDGAELFDTPVAPSQHSLNSGWLGSSLDRVLAPHQTVELEFEFAEDVIWTY